MVFRDVCQVSDVLGCGNEHRKHLNTSLGSAVNDGGSGWITGMRAVERRSAPFGVQGVFSLMAGMNTPDTSSEDMAIVFCQGDGAA